LLRACGLPFTFDASRTTYLCAHFCSFSAGFVCLLRYVSRGSTHSSSPGLRYYFLRSLLRCTHTLSPLHMVCAHAHAPHRVPVWTPATTASSGHTYCAGFGFYFTPVYARSSFRRAAPALFFCPTTRDMPHRVLEHCVPLLRIYTRLHFFRLPRTSGLRCRTFTHAAVATAAFALFACYVHHATRFLPHAVYVTPTRSLPSGFARTRLLVHWLRSSTFHLFVYATSGLVVRLHTFSHGCRLHLHTRITWFCRSRFLDGYTHHARARFTGWFSPPLLTWTHTTHSHIHHTFPFHAMGLTTTPCVLRTRHVRISHAFVYHRLRHFLRFTLVHGSRSIPTPGLFGFP